MAMFVKSNLLRPLDVVLLRSKGLESKGIKISTFGPYSHAALVMSRTLRFESHDPGVIFTPATFTHLCIENGACSLFDDVSKYIKFDVFRHPDIAAMDAIALEGIQQKAVKVTSKFNFAQYPSYEVFDKLAERHLGLDDETRRRILRFMARNQNVIVPGPFCSQLVVEIYRQLGFRLFDVELASEVIAPNDLLDSCLRPVAEIVTDSAPTTNDLKLLEFADRIAGRLDREDDEFVYTAVKLQQDELLRHAMVDLVEDPKRRDQVDPAAVREATAAIAEAFTCLQANDEKKVIDSIRREKRFFELVNAGGDYLAALAGDPLLERPTERPDYKEETNRCFAAMRKIIEQRKPQFFDRKGTE